MTCCSINLIWWLSGVGDINTASDHSGQVDTIDITNLGQTRPQHYYNSSNMIDGEESKFSMIC